MHFSEAVIVVIVKAYIVIVLDILFKHALWTGALDLDFMQEWLCFDFMSSLDIIYICLALKCVSVKGW